MKRFISHAAPLDDGFRPEVWVETGEGTVTEIEPSSAGKSVQVFITAAEPGLKKPITGWLAADDPIMDLVADAKETGAQIAWRVEWTRKRDIDPRTPIIELRGMKDANSDADMKACAENGVRKFVGINGNRSREALTHPAEDPTTDVAAVTDEMVEQMKGSPKSATAAVGMSAADALKALGAAASKTDLPYTVLVPLAAAALAAGADAREVSNLLHRGLPFPGSDDDRRRLGAIAEPAPTWPCKASGERSLGSYEVQAAVGAVTWADTYTRAHLPERDPAPFVAPVAALLLGLADAVQVAVYGGGRPNRMASSHARARGVVIHVIEAQAQSLFGVGDARQEWVDAVLEQATGLMTTAISVLDDTPAILAAIHVSIPGVADAPAPAPEPQPEPAPESQPAPEPKPAASRQAKPEPVAPDTEPGESAVAGASDEDLRAFAKLATLAGFTDDPAKVAAWLDATFGVRVAREVPADMLIDTLAHYRSFGVNGVDEFRADVLAVAADAA